jgi:hypothetical protein
MKDIQRAYKIELEDGDRKHENSPFRGRSR